jgi:ATP-binding protein involved in chromosome partitioning
MPGSQTMKIAVPVAEGLLCNHFGHCQQFAVIKVEAGKVMEPEFLTPPPHEPGVLPQWLGDMGVSLIIAGGMGQRAIGLFAQRGIKVVVGAPNLPPMDLVNSFLAGSLISGTNVCDH